MKFILLALISVSTIFAMDIETPVKEFSVTGFYVRGQTDRYLEFPAYNGVKVKVGLLTEVEVDELKTYTLRSLADGSIIGSIEEQNRQKTGLVSYLQNYLLKNKNNEPIGILVVNSGWDYDLQLFTTNGATLINRVDWSADYYTDYFLGEKLSVNERFYMNPVRTTVIENIEIFNNNPDFWMAFVLVKALLWNPGQF